MLYNEESQTWVKKIDNSTRYTTVDDALNAASKIREFEKSVKIEEVVDYDSGIGTMTLGGAEKLERTKKMFSLN